MFAGYFTFNVVKFAHKRLGVNIFLKNFLGIFRPVFGGGRTGGRGERGEH